MGSVVKGERCLIAINYEPPGAFNGSIAEAYGQMTAQNARAEFQLKAAEARSQAQARSQANQNQQDALAQKSYEFDQSQMPSERDQFNAAQQANQTQAHIGGQMALQQQSQQFRNQEYQRDFNYSDNLRLQNAQQQRNLIDQDSTLTPAEKQRAIAMVDPTISALTFQQRQTQQRLEQQQISRIASQQAHQDGLDAIHRQQVGQQGTAGHYRIPDSNDPTGQTMLPGWYQRNYRGETELIPGTAPGGRGASGTGTNSPGQIPPQIVSAIDHATRTVDSALAHTGETALPEDHEFRRDRLGAITRIARENRQVAEQMTAEDRDIRSRLANGPLPFDVPSQAQPTDIPGVVQNQLQSNINRAITTAEARNAPRESEQLRSLAMSLNNGKSTGDLDQAQQRLLQSTGYYRSEFTPQLDRQISQAIQRPPQVIQAGGQRVIQRQPPSPEMQEAASGLRSILAAFGGRPPESAPQARQRFDEMRGRIGFTEWPPPLSRHSDRPPIPVANPRPSSSNSAISFDNPYLGMS